MATQTGTKPQVVPETKLTLDRQTVASLVMLASSVGAGIGAGFQWGTGAGVFATSLLLFVTGVLLGIG